MSQTTTSRITLVTAYALVVACSGDKSPMSSLAPQPPPPPEAPQAPIGSRSVGWAPAGQVVCDEDFTRFRDWAAFLLTSSCTWGNKVQLDNWGRNNVDIDLGGLTYRYRAEPHRCGDQIVGQATIPLPAGTREVWLEWDATFSTNFETSNPNCSSSPAPDFKYVLVWLRGDAGCGIDRAELKMGQGGNQIAAAVPGFPQCDDAKVNGTVRVPGARSYFDGQPHHFRLSYRMLGDSLYEVYLSIDEVVTHSYVTRSVSDAGLTFERVMLGSNRNLGATSDMFLHWKNMKVWVR